MIPLSAFSSVQMALYRRDFNFKFLLNIRLITILTPILISIPMALMGYDYLVFNCWYARVSAIYGVGIIKESEESNSSVF